GPFWPTGQALLNRCRELAPSAGAVLWLGPSYRALEWVRAQLSEPVEKLHLYTFADFAGTIVTAHDPRARHLSQLHRRLLTDELAASLAANGRLGYFQDVLDTRGFGEALFNLMTELSEVELAPEQIDQIFQDRFATAGKHQSYVIVYREYQAL